MIDYLGLWILIALSLNMWALLSVLRSRASFTARVIWGLVLIALPGVGFLGWYLFGPRQHTA